MRVKSPLRYALRVPSRNPFFVGGLSKFGVLGSKTGQPISPATTTSRRVYYGTTATLTIATGTGTISKNGGAFGASVDVVPGDYIQVKVTNSASYSDPVAITLSNSDTFTVTTMAEPVAEASIADRYTNTDHYTNMAHYV